ncbi:MAG: hypothetical protein R2733_18655 [Acidimicrobiales bacterium]
MSVDEDQVASAGVGRPMRTGPFSHYAWVILTVAFVGLLAS